MLLRLWKFVRNGKNREIVSWLGGGAAVIIVGMWTLFTYLHDEGKPTASSTTVIAPMVSAITSGRDTVVNAPVNIGVNEKRVGEQITDAQKPLVDRLERLAAQAAREKGVEIAPLRAILVKMGEAGVRDEDIAKRLDEKADELTSLRAEITRLKRGPASLASFAQQAQTLIDKGDLDGARAALAEGRAAARAVREQSSGYEADFLAQQAKVDHLQLAYQHAAANYAEAAALIAPFDQKKQWEFTLAQANELKSQGDEFGDNATLAAAINVYRGCLLLVPRAQRPLDWAMTQDNLGKALSVLGERESRSAALDEAVSAFHAALEVRTRERAPRLWAMTQTNLGWALLLLGHRERRTALEEAVLAFRAALDVTTRDSMPFQWAAVQFGLSSALTELGARDGTTARLKEAISVSRAALEVVTRERAPRQWAGAQVDLGIAFTILGKRESDLERLEEAVSFFRAALAVYTREREPVQWAIAQARLGAVLLLLGKGERGSERLEEAVSAFRASLEVRTRDGTPQFWAYSMDQLAIALAGLAVPTGDATRLQEAVTCMRGAVEVYLQERNSPFLPIAKGRLAEMTAQLAALKQR